MEIIDGVGWMAMNVLSGKIEALRQQLMETVDHCCGDFLNPDVLRISQELDLLIVEMQREKRVPKYPHLSVVSDDACLSEASEP